jgi:hypothetical protein
MPRGPKGERRPADVIGAAIMVAKIATGEIDDDFGKPPNAEEKADLAWKRAAMLDELPQSN